MSCKSCPVWSSYLAARHKFEYATDISSPLLMAIATQQMRRLPNTYVLRNYCTANGREQWSTDRALQLQRHELVHLGCKLHRQLLEDLQIDCTTHSSVVLGNRDQHVLFELCLIWSSGCCTAEKIVNLFTTSLTYPCEPAIQALARSACLSPPSTPSFHTTFLQREECDAP